MENNSKKVLIFSTAYYPLVGGAEVAIKEITDRIPEVEFDLITAKMDKKLPFREKIGNVTVYRLGIGKPFIDKIILALEGAFFVRHLEKKNTYTAYWCMMATFAAGAAYIRNILKSKKTPIVLTLQEGDSEKYLTTKWFGLLDFSWRLSLKRTAILTVISNYLGERAKRLGYKGEIKLIPNGVDISKFAQRISVEEREKIRAAWGVKKEDVLLITASRLTIKNGIEDIISSLTLLPEHIKFIIFGTGELETKLRKITHDLKLEQRVLFKGFVQNTDLPNYLKAADIFIRPSLSEGFGNSFIESFAARVPVIATPVGGIPDFLKQGETGYFCEPQNPKSIAEAVQKVISDPNKNKIIDQAYELVKEKYDWNLVAEKMKEVLFHM